MDLLLVMAMLAGGQDASASATQPPAAPGAAETSRGRIICRRMQMTGTRLSRVRVCQTQAEWDGRLATSQNDLRSFQDRQSVVNYGLSGRSTCPSSVPC